MKSEISNGVNLKEQLKEDLKVSLKERDEVKTGTLRMLMAAITNKEKEALRPASLAQAVRGSEEPSGSRRGKDEELSDGEMQDVVATEAKKRREASDAFLKGARPELAEKEQQELKILLAYLPEQLTEEQIQELVKKAIQKTGAQDIKDMGKVMGKLAPLVKGRADGAVVSKIVKESLV